MKALILYRSFYGTTRSVAETMAKAITALGHEAVVHDVRTRLPDLAGFDCALVGAPPRMARVNGKVLRVLKRLGKKGFAAKPVAIFDLYGPVPTKPEELEKGQKWITPGAAGIMKRTARDAGLRVFGKVLRCEVAGMRGPLKEREQEKAAEFAEEFLSGAGP